MGTCFGATAARRIARSRLILASCAACALLSVLPTGCGSSGPRYLAQPMVVTTPNGYHHRPSGTTFPLEVGQFRRHAVLQYDVGGLDVSAAYGLNTPSAVMHATVFVYPIPGPGGAGVSRRTDAGEQAAHCRQEFDARKWQLARAHPGSRIIREGITEITQGTVTAKGEYAIIGYDGMWQGRSAHLAARLYVFCPVGETWILKYRFTHRDLLDADQAIDGFLRTWSGATNGPRQPR